MEIYIAYRLLWMMAFTEEMLERVALALMAQPRLPLAIKVSFKRPIPLNHRSQCNEACRIDITGKTEDELRKISQV